MNAQPALSETAPSSAPYTDRFWTSQDGLKLHFRDYPGPSDRPPILCLPGLTRNARDFSHVAERLAGEWRTREDGEVGGNSTVTLELVGRYNTDLGYALYSSVVNDRATLP